MTILTTSLTVFGATTAALGVVAAGMIAPKSRMWGQVICRGNRVGRQVALTFDDGPTKGATDDVLDVLLRESVKATFFVIGTNVQRAPDLLRRMDAEGHEIGNHSYSHSHYGCMRLWRYWQQEIEKTDDAIERITGRRPNAFRPPMGVKSPFIAGAAARAGHTLVTWSLRGMDGVSTSPGNILARILNRATAGDIIALHDGVEPHGRLDSRATIDALPNMIRGLRDGDLEPVRLDRLIDAPQLRSSLVT